MSQRGRNSGDVSVGDRIEGQVHRVVIGRAGQWGEED